MSEADNEHRVRAFYEATIPGHRESLRGLQAPHVIYDLPLGMPIGPAPIPPLIGDCRCIQGDCLKALTTSCGATACSSVLWLRRRPNFFMSMVTSSVFMSG